MTIPKAGQPARSSVDMSPPAVSARLRLVGSLSDLRLERRLDAKLDMTPSGVAGRLREVSELLLACHALARAGGRLRDTAL